MRLLRSTPTVLFVLFLLATHGAAALDLCEIQAGPWIPFGDVSWPSSGGTDECSFIVGLADVGGMTRWATDEDGSIEVDLHANFRRAELPANTVLRMFDIRDYAQNQLVVLELLDAETTVLGDLRTRLLYRDGSGQIHVLSDPNAIVPRGDVDLRVVWQRADSDIPGSVQLWADRGHGFELLVADDSVDNSGQSAAQLHFGSLGHSGPQPGGRVGYEILGWQID